MMQPYFPLPLAFPDYSKKSLLDASEGIEALLKLPRDTEAVSQGTTGCQIIEV